MPDFRAGRGAAMGTTNRRELTRTDPRMAKKIQPTSDLLRGNPLNILVMELWVLRSTLTLKTTDTTLVSVDGNIGHRGALTRLPHASPETITKETPSATVTPTQSHGRGKARPRS